MKYLLLSLLILCGSMAGMAQTHEQVLEYYNKVNLAELAICDSNFSAANKYYSEAFAINNKKAFYYDLLNAFFSAMDSHEYRLAESYFAQFMRRGLDSEYVSHIKRAYSGADRKRIDAFSAKYPNYMSVLKKTPLMKELKQMVAWDRDVRYYYYGVEGLADYMTDSTFKVDDINARHLLKIFLQKGVPGEAIKGETHYDIIIWHNTGAGFGGYRGHIFDSLLYNAVFKFDYDARLFAINIGESRMSYTFKCGNTTLNFPLIVDGASYNHAIYCEVYDDTSEAQINREREKLGLGTLANIRKKTDASNTGLDSNSVLHKYGLSSPMSVVDMKTEAELKNWLVTKGKDAPVKPPFNFRAFEHLLDIGQINDFTIDKTSYGDVTKFFDRYIKEYDEGNMYLSSWRNGHPVLKWNCHARVIDNPKEDLSTEAGRRNHSQFITGYKLFVDEGWGGPFYLHNVIYLFGQDDKLISFKADVGVKFGNVMTNYCGKPDSFTTKYSTQYYKNDQHYKISLITKRYVWIKDNVKVLVVVADELDKDWKKRTYATYRMTDTPAYGEYLQKVDEKKKELDKEYAKVEKR